MASSDVEIRPIMTRDEGARYLRVGLNKFDELVRQGRIAVKKEGRRVLVLGRSLERYTTES